MVRASFALIQRGLIKDPKFKDWILGVQVKSNKKLVGFITAYPGIIRIRETTLPIANVNFLCVHKKLRDKRMSPLLIKEITRRCNRLGYFQALFTSGKQTPTPFSAVRYFHRSLNPKKLIEIGISSLKSKETLSRLSRLCKTNEVILNIYAKQPIMPGWRFMEAKDVSQVTKLLNEYLKNFQVAPVFSADEVRIRLLPKEDAIYSFVVEVTLGIFDFLIGSGIPSSY
jgi:glycylpeptide N-tetradecanoyltransferase